MLALIALFAQVPLAFQQPDIQVPRQPEIQIAQGGKKGPPIQPPVVPPDLDAQMKKAMEDALKAQQQNPFGPGPGPNIVIQQPPMWNRVGYGGGITDQITSGLQLLMLIGEIVGMWKIFEKAGRPGWHALVPFYNIYSLFEVAGKPGIHGILGALLCCCFGIGLIWYIPGMIALSRKFGKDTGFGIGLLLLPGIFMPILGFSSAEYRSKNKKKKRRDDDDEDEEDEDRPRKRRRDEEDEDEDDRPRRRPKDEEDEDDAPRRRRKVADEDDEEEERIKPPPRRRPRDEEEEEEEERKPPPRRRPRDEEDDDEPPPPPRRKR